jgi:hypothetical protein
MEARIIGLKGSGKTTLLAAMADGHTERPVATVKLGDPRLRHLSRVFNPARTTCAEFVTRVATWPEATARKGAMERYLNAVGGAQVFLHVLRGFDNPLLGTPIDPAADLATLDQEFLLADLMAVERALERERKYQLPAPSRQALLSARAVLDEDRPLRDGAFDETQASFLKTYGLLTLTPQVVLLNVEADGEEGARSEAVSAAMAQAVDGRRLLAFPFALALEVAELPEESRVEFAREMGLPGLAHDLVTQAAFEQMGLITYFTVGEDEVRAWPIRRGTRAQQAAGVIHSDIEKGFIRAEVVSYADFVEKGSLKTCREAGLLRLEGKEYVVGDGDIIEFRFNV